MRSTQSSGVEERDYANQWWFSNGDPHNIEIIHTDNTGRVLAFRRWDNTTEYLIAANLNNAAFDNPSYLLTHPSLGSAGWRECFNSDSAAYGGSNVGNAGATLRAGGGTLGLVIPANGFVVLERGLLR